MMTIDTFFLVLVIFGVCYRMSTLTGVFETEAFLFRVIKGLFYLLLWKGLTYLIPDIQKSVNENTKELFTIGIPAAVIFAWFVAPWIYTFIRIKKGISTTEGMGWIAFASVANVALGFVCNTLQL